MPEFRLSLDPNALHRTLSARILLGLERTILALNSIGNADDNSGLLPGVALPTMAIQVNQRPTDVVREETLPWIIGCTLRDWLEEVSLFLVEVQRTCGLVNAFEGFDVPMKSETFNAIQAATTRFEKKNFPRKIEALRKAYGDVVDENLQYVDTLRQARNCLVHRLGVVSKPDCNLGDRLSIRWRGAELLVQNPGNEEQPAAEGVVLKPGGQVLQSHPEVERTFTVGERISLTTTDICGIWWTINSFGVGTAKRVFDFAKAKGLMAAPAADKNDLGS